MARAGRGARRARSRSGRPLRHLVAHERHPRRGHVAHDARRPGARDRVPLPRRGALAERADCRDARLVPNRPVARLDGCYRSAGRGRCTGHHGQRFAVRTSACTTTRRDADPADNPARGKPAPARDTARRELLAVPRERQRDLPADGLAPVPDLLPDVDRSRHQSLPRCRVLDHRRAVRPPLRQGDVDGRREHARCQRSRPGRLAPPGRGRHVRRRGEQAPAAEGRRPRHVPHPHRPLLPARSASDEGPWDLSGFLRQRGCDRLRHVPHRGPLLARADRQCLLDAAGAHLTHTRQADVPVDRSGSHGALPREPGSDSRRRPRRDLARDRRAAHAASATSRTGGRRASAPRSAS